MTAVPATRADQLPTISPDAGDLVKLAADHLYAGTEHDDPDQLAAATGYALVAIADALTRLADRHAPDLATIRITHDDR